MTFCSKVDVYVYKALDSGKGLVYVYDVKTLAAPVQWRGN
jgi:hypothetical protein